MPSLNLTSVSENKRKRRVDLKVKFVKIKGKERTSEFIKERDPTLVGDKTGSLGNNLIDNLLSVPR